MQIIFTTEARFEMVEASLYYEGLRPGLGGDFEAEITYYLHSVAAAPELPRLRKGDYRRVNLRRFPYYISYSIEQGAVIILAVGHGARRPEYWIKAKP